MKRILLPILIALAAAGTIVPVGAEDNWERILSFESEIVVQADASMTVRETIRVNCAGLQIKRGIYRDFPTKYKDRFGNNMKVDFALLEVLRDGRPEPFRLENRSNGVRIYIGREDVYLDPGEYTYSLLYRTDRQLGFFKEHDELYWNVTGNGWIFPIERTSAKVKLPDGVPADAITAGAYTGPQGAKGGDFTSVLDDSGRVIFTATRPFGPYEGLTVVVCWPKGHVAEPTASRRLGWFIRDNLGLLITFLGMLAVLVYYLHAWNKVGRDPAKGTIIPRFEPPKGHSPASVRYVLRMGYDQKCFAAAAIDMAVRGYLTIDKTGRQYMLKKTGADESALSPSELVLAGRLFSRGDTIELDQDNYEVIGGASRALLEYLRKKFLKVLFHTNSGYVAGGFALSFLVGFLGSTATPSPAAIILATVLGLPLNLIFLRLLKAPTVSGRRIMDEIEGFRMYLSVAEKDRLNLLNPPEETPELFEKFLPYALALDVEQQWGERFAVVLARAAVDSRGYHPIWYAGDAWDLHRPGRFASSLGGSFASAISSSSSPPGSSSGGGGGGCSGGGGGGGGGGGW